MLGVLMQSSGKMPPLWFGPTSPALLTSGPPAFCLHRSWFFCMQWFPFPPCCPLFLGLLTATFCVRKSPPCLSLSPWVPKSSRIDFHCGIVRNVLDVCSPSLSVSDICQAECWAHWTVLVTPEWINEKNFKAPSLSPGSHHFPWIVIAYTHVLILLINRKLWKVKNHVGFLVTGISGSFKHIGSSDNVNCNQEKIFQCWPISCLTIQFWCRVWLSLSSSRSHLPLWGYTVSCD